MPYSFTVVYCGKTPFIPAARFLVAAHREAALEDALVLLAVYYRRGFVERHVGARVYRERRMGEDEVARREQRVAYRLSAEARRAAEGRGYPHHGVV